MLTSPILNELMDVLPSVACCHSPQGTLAPFLKKVARREVEGLFQKSGLSAVHFHPFGSLKFPYFKMGAVDSLNLFDIDELIIFSFYWANRKRYRRTADIGANIGLHSIIMSKCGYTVDCYEPDPIHFKLLARNLKLNKCAKVTPHNAAVSNESGAKEFVRVLGNTTGSHLAGAKANPYGKLERFPVQVEAIADVLKDVDLLKIDAEGHEKEILLSTTKEQWKRTDAMIEVQNAQNAKALYDHFGKMKVNLFSQKTNWQKVVSLRDIPVGYKEGSLFITSKKEMPWV